MANYTGTINVPTRFVYKNQTAFDQNTPSYNTRWSNVQIHIPSPNQIIEQFGDPHYFTNDSQQTRPYYFLQTKIGDTPFDFKNVPISFIVPQNLDGNVGLSANSPMDLNDGVPPTREEIDADKYGVVFRSGSNIQTAFLSQGRGSQNNSTAHLNNTSGIIPNVITFIKNNTLNSANVIGLKNTYITDKDAYLCVDLLNNYNLMYKDYQGTGTIEGAYLTDRGNRTFTYKGASHNNVDMNVSTYYRAEDKTLYAKNTNNGYTSTNIVLNTYNFRISAYYNPSSGDPYKVYQYSYQTSWGYAFLYDGTDVWILIGGYFHNRPYDSGQYLVENVGEMLNWTLCKVKDIPTSWPDWSSLDGRWSASPSYPGSNIRMNDTFLELLNIEETPTPPPSDYDDEDIEPGVGDGEDPYEDIDNSDAPSSVGGDHDLENHITDVDDTPNTSYESFIASTNFFGSYKLSLQNLQNYAETLKVLYEHSTDIAIGGAYSAYANRITEGTTSLIMLPFSNWKTQADSQGPADYTNGEFAIGGAGIKANGVSFTNYVLGGDGAFDNADLMNTYTKRWTVQLDPIIRKYDNFLDYAPYSKASIFIPYVGQYELPINLIQSAKNDDHKIGLRVKFGLNVSNGDVIAIFEAEIKNDTNNWTYTPLGTWTGNCARAIRLAVSDDSQAIREGVRALTSMVSFAASGGASQGLMTQTSSGHQNTRIGDDFTREASSYGGSDTGTVGTSHGSSIGFSGNASSAMPNSIAPGQHLIGGATTAGELGWLGVQNIVVKVERPIWWMPGKYSNLFGYPTKRYATLRNLTGFATVSRIHLRCSATGPEKEEIERLLSEGVIFGAT